MRSFSKDIAERILTNQIEVNILLQQYPEYQAEVLKEIGVLKNEHESRLIHAIIGKYTASAKMAGSKIQKSNFNEKTINAFLPNLIKARMAIYLLEQLNIAISSKTISSKVRFNVWDGIILQRLLFRKGFDRKEVSLRWFHLFWRFITDKKILMPLVNKKGIYCFYSKPLIEELVKLTDNKRCLEIGAGDGTLTKFLNKKNVQCVATDDYSWEHYIHYPDFVERLDARAALFKYSPEVVLCSWPVPKNSYEKHVFKKASVGVYIVIGTRSSAYTGDFEAYVNNGMFTMELDEHLSSLVLPSSAENAVYVFRRILR
ncbi:SAM-dependent methyltransferase [Paenibacillus sp. IHB B 3415]|uniref:SAM-dependent methyltransferase n=1 Tax=Paenibacillus sp. IHB B 3415 TaxID=867080 RepID=UPI0005756E14|nr:SAM-dependent methyltransferase [Paenibacillus sp. IHB B 3415]KHL97109.1 SAM-dependent methyltransferase [Paenibacillus sp. IHB B 3415]